MEIKHIFMFTLSAFIVILFIIYIIHNNSLIVIPKNVKSYTKFSKIITIYGVIIILLSLINFGLSIFNAVTANGSIYKHVSLLVAGCSFCFVIGGLLIIEHNNNNKKNDK